MRVMIAEDSILLRKGMDLLMVEEGHELQASVGDGDALVAAIATAKELPDVVVVDVRMPPTHTDEGIRAAITIRERWPSVGVLVFSQYVETAYATELITSNQDRVGYLLKDRVMRVEEFLSALERVGSGGVAFEPTLVRQLMARTSHTDPLNRLTTRERDVLAKMAEGHINSRIADELFISQSAVEKHINSIFDKFELNHVTGYSRRVLAILRYLGT